MTLPTDFSSCKCPLLMALQTILVTGGSDGMGRALAIQLAAKGAHVVVVARTVSKLEYTVDALKVNPYPWTQVFDHSAHPSRSTMLGTP